MSEEIHRGQLVKNAVKKSGIKISELARKIGRSRRFIYLMFDKQDVPYHYMIKIGEAINHDFFEETEYNHNNIPPSYQEEVYWKDRFIALLEEYIKLIKSNYGKH